MARIRTLKPDFWTDENVGECSIPARLLFIATWSFADDHGGLDRSSKQLKAQAFPYDVIDCEPLVQELVTAGLLIEYEVDSRKYLHIKGFNTHQKVEKPARPRVPIYQSSPTSRGEVGEELPGSCGLFSGREGKGREGGSTEATPTNGAHPVVPSGLDLPSWARWLDYRKQIRKPLKPVSIPAAQRELAAYGPDQAAVVEQSIAKGWQGLFALKSRAPETPKEGRTHAGLPIVNP